jgi:hypothetical protein
MDKTGRKEDLCHYKLRQFASPPSPLCQGRALSNRHNHYQSAAAIGLPLGPSTAQELQSDYFVVKMTHLLMWTIGWPLCHRATGPAAKDKTTMRTTPAWNMDEPGWDRREAIAKSRSQSRSRSCSQSRHQSCS